VLQRHKNYNPKLDTRDKVNELRKLYDWMQSENVSEADQRWNDELSEKTQRYFEWEKTRNSDLQIT
jgi:aromatic ring hydroxylase